MHGTTVKITFEHVIQASVAVSGVSRILEDVDSSDLRNVGNSAFFLRRDIIQKQIHVVIRTLIQQLEQHRGQGSSTDTVSGMLVKLRPVMIKRARKRFIEIFSALYYKCRKRISDTCSNACPPVCSFDSGRAMICQLVR
jgi:hypothetical protein